MCVRLCVAWLRLLTLKQLLIQRFLPFDFEAALKRAHAHDVLETVCDDDTDDDVVVVVDDDKKSNDDDINTELYEQWMWSNTIFRSELPNQTNL